MKKNKSSSHSTVKPRLWLRLLLQIFEHVINRCFCVTNLIEISSTVMSQLSYNPKQAISIEYKNRIGFNIDIFMITALKKGILK